MPDVRPLRPGDPERIGGYRLVGVLGSGGQGVVYRGVGEDGREVAVKLIHSHLSRDDDVRKGFLREVEAARRVGAVYTAAVLDVGMLDERPYIVSEYVAGDTLQAYVQSSGPRTGGALDRLANSTLAALVAIHNAGIVHRDFKPANVLVGPEGPIVIDFGIAKALDSTTQASGPIGTPTYMSPEQFRGERVGPASDLFSWAGTMVYAATGRQPFPGDTVPAIVNGVLSGSPDLSGMPPHLVDSIQACLAKDPADRPVAADLLRQLIRRTGPTAGPFPEPSPAPDAEVPPRPPRQISRRVLIGGAAAAAAAAVSAFAVLRPGSGLFSPGGEQVNPPGRDSGPSLSSSSSASPSSSPTPAASPEPFGAQVKDPVTLTAGSGEPTALAAAGATVVCGTAKGTALLWDMNTATAVTELGDGGGSVTSVASGIVSGTPVTASGHADGRMRLWTQTGAEHASHRAGDPIIAVSIGDRAVAVSQKYDGMTDLHSVVRLWDIATGKQIGATITEHFQGVRGLTFGRLGQNDVLITGDGGERIRVWNLSTGKLTRSFRTGEIGGIELLACGQMNGKPVLVSTHLDATLRVYDLATGKRKKRWTFSDVSPDDRGTAALTAGQFGDVPIAVVAHSPAGADITVRIWNLDDGETIGTLGSGGATGTLTLAEFAGRPIVVTAGEDRILRTWSLGRT
ncbi:serine/threonine-protein kinase [Acrocarpospora sp. B8E8]|uniref:WD40 repeat domain-containing serine/threonine protein kinase n=1 Tax=Acrocarpospora sp. B8E8 TaxID=3153572 RepID=UPI00325F1829